MDDSAHSRHTKVLALVLLVGTGAGEHKEVVFFPKLTDAGRPNVTKVPGFPKDYHYVQGVSH